MKILTAILLIVLMIGASPVFADNSPVDEKTAASEAVGGTDNDIMDEYQETDQSEDIGDYIVVDSSDLPDASGENEAYGDETDNGIYTAASSLDTSDKHNSGEYTDPANNGDHADSSDESDPLDEDSGYIDGYDDNGNYIGYYIVVDPSDEEGDYTDELADEEMDEDDYIVIDSPDEQLCGCETVSIDEPITTKPLLVTLVDRLCGVVQLLL